MCKYNMYCVSMSHMAPLVNAERIVRPHATAMTYIPASYFLIDALPDVPVTFYNIQRRDGRD